MFLLADAATVREGLLNILGLGINIVRRPEFPAPLGLPLAMLLELSPGGEEEHEIALSIRAEHDPPIAEISMTTIKVGPGEVPSLPSYVPVVLPTQMIMLPRPGRYRAAVEIDGEVVAAVVFDASLLASDPEKDQGHATAEPLVSSE